jgi:hypothetical protein
MESGRNNGKQKLLHNVGQSQLIIGTDAVLRRQLARVLIYNRWNNWPMFEWGNALNRVELEVVVVSVE